MRRRETDRKDSGGWEGRKGKHGRVYFSKLPSEESTGIQDFPREFGSLATERAARFCSRIVALVDMIAVLFFFPFRLFSLPFRPIFLSFYIASCAEYMNPIFVKVTRGTIAVNRRKAMADLRVSHLKTRERWDWLVRKIFIIRKLTRNRKRVLFFILSALLSTPMVAKSKE